MEKSEKKDSTIFKEVLAKNIRTNWGKDISKEKEGDKDDKRDEQPGAPD